MVPAIYLTLVLAVTATAALPGMARAAGGTYSGVNTNASPYPGRPVPGRPIPTRPSPYNYVPTVKRPAIKPLDGSANRDIKPKPPPFERSYGGTSRTPAECEALARRALDSNSKKLWARYRACVDMTAD